MSDELKLPCLWCLKQITEKEDIDGYCINCAANVFQKSFIKHYELEYGESLPYSNKSAWKRK